MTAAEPLVERLAGVLARHRREFDNDCTCSEYVLDVPYEQHVARALLPVVEQAVAEARGEADGYRNLCRVQADLIVKARAQAWDEGYDARGEDIANEGLIYTELTPNPYRADAIATMEGAP